MAAMRWEYSGLGARQPRGMLCAKNATHIVMTTKMLRRHTARTPRAEPAERDQDERQKGQQRQRAHGQEDQMLRHVRPLRSARETIRGFVLPRASGHDTLATGAIGTLA